MRPIVKAFRRPPTGRLLDQNGGLPRLSDGVAHALRCPASRQRTLLAESLGKPSLWAIIGNPWYNPMARKQKRPTGRVVAENRKARHHFFIEDTLEAGIMLEGSEVKSLREGRANIAESYATVEGAELWLINSYIGPFSQTMAAAFSHDARRRPVALVGVNERGLQQEQRGQYGILARSCLLGGRDCFVHRRQRHVEFEFVELTQRSYK